MAKYSELEISFGGDKFIFVTRGKAKPFTEEEALGYLEARQKLVAEVSNDPIGEPAFTLEESVVEDEEEEFRIPDDRMRRHMFDRDLRQMGVHWCADKYGVSVEAIQKEAQRLATKETRSG